MLLEEQLQTVGRPLRPEIQRGLAADALLGRALDGRTRCSGRVDFLDQLDFGVLEKAVQLLDVGFVEAELGRGGRDLDVCEHADLQPARNQTLDLFELLQIPYRHPVAFPFNQ